MGENTAPIQSADLSGVIERASSLTGPSREVDRLIQCSIGGWHRVTPSQARNKHGAFIAPGDWIGRHGDGSPILDSLHGTTMHRDVPAVTASVDAAMSLAARALTGWVFDEIAQDYATAPDGYHAFGWNVEMINGIRVQGQSQSLPIAICIATLRALQSKGEA